jgi:HD-like signal output (HDOD) protein
MNVIDGFLEKINNLPMLPKAVQDVTALLNQENIDNKELTQTIGHDQVLSARVLRLSNSAYFGCSRSVKTIDDAVSLIGYNSLKTLVIASGVTSAFTKVPGLDLRKFWQQSLVTAEIARQISKELKLEPETAYLAGLMHSVGQLPIHLVFPEAGARIQEACQGRSVLERKNVEHSELGIDHCQVGELLAKVWNFPEDISRVIRYYADPFNAQACAYAPVVYAAVHIAFDLQQDKDASYIAETLNQEVAKALNMPAETLINRIETYRELANQAKTYI